MIQRISLNLTENGHFQMMNTLLQNVKANFVHKKEWAQRTLENVITNLAMPIRKSFYKSQDLKFDVNATRARSYKIQELRDKVECSLTEFLSAN